MIDLFSNHDCEYQESEKALIMQCDCLPILRSMKEESVDLIFADPPYNLGKDFGNESDSWANRKEYLEWCYSWINECFRVLKENGTVYLMNSTQNMPFISVYIQQHYYVVNDIVWTYDSSGVQSKKKYGSLYEPILMCTKKAGVQYTFNYKDILVEAKTGAKRGLIDYRKNPPRPYNTEKVPGNVWSFPRVRYKMEEYENHPSQKPMALIERIVKASSNPKEIVLDPFGGSFTTAAVAVSLGRRAISMDINQEYYKIGLRRSGVATEYDGKLLQPDKSRKTKNRSKKDSLIDDNQVMFSME